MELFEVKLRALQGAKAMQVLARLNESHWWAGKALAIAGVA